MHIFKKQDLEFDTGFHYVGNDPMLHKIFQLILADPVDWNVYQTFDQIEVNGKKFMYQKGLRKVIAGLIELFPQEEEKLRRLQKKLAVSAKIFGLVPMSKAIFPSLVRKVFLKVLGLIYGMDHLQSLESVLDSIGFRPNTDVYTFITAQVYDLGIPPSHIPFGLYAGLLLHYIANGMMYPKEGVISIVRSMMKTILAHGGRVLMKASVKQILVQNGRAVGVELENSDIIMCDNLISTFGLELTNRLLPESHKFTPKVAPQFKLYDDQEAFSTNSLFLGFAGEKITLPTENLWYWRLDESKDPQKSEKRYLE